MYVVRPVMKKDLEQLYKLSSLTKAGLTTFPHNKKLLRRRIDKSIYDFSQAVTKPNGENYFFVMEETQSGRVVGTCAVMSKVGGFEPSYTYELKTAVKKSRTLGVTRKIQYLVLKKEYNGPSEIGTLFLSPDVRQKGLGRLLSLSRFLFMAQYPQCFEEFVIAEMRGILDEDDRSPFWNAVCKHFFEMEFKKADLMVMEDKSFIADLIPEHPIYIPILPLSAQRAIGQVHKETESALRLLNQENFKFINEIDIFEAGPVVGTKVKNIRTVKKSREVKVSKIVHMINRQSVYLIANATGIDRFRAIMGTLIKNEKGITIQRDVAQALKVKEGDKVRFASISG